MRGGLTGRSRRGIIEFLVMAARQGGFPAWIDPPIMEIEKMSKQQNSKATKASPTNLFAIGDKVLASMPSLSEDNLGGTIEAITQTGWVKVRLDIALDKVGVKDGCISCRTRSLIAMPKDWTPADPIDESADDASGEYFQGNREAPVLVLTGQTAEEIAAPNDGEEEDKALTPQERMAKALREARTHYTHCKRPNGTATAHNGDDIAKALRDYEPTEVADLADKCLGVPVGTHFLKYGHLNNGQIRMNSGNRIRATYAKALKDQDAETISRICHVLGLDDDEEQDDAE